MKEKKINHKPLVLNKHLAAIHIDNTSLSFVDKKIMNVLLFNTKKNIGKKDFHYIEISEIIKNIGWKNANTKEIRRSLKKLVDTTIEWNILGKDRKNKWTYTKLLAGISLDEKAGFIRFSYTPDLIQRLKEPNIFARLELEMQREFNNKYSLSLWEYCTGVYSSSRNSQVTSSDIISLDDYRKLIGVKESAYAQFKIFNNHRIKQPVEEINKLSPLNVTVRYLKKEGKTSALQFIIEKKKFYNGELDFQAYDIENNITTEFSVVVNKLKEICGLNDKEINQILRIYSPIYIKDRLRNIEKQIKKGLIKNKRMYSLKIIKNEKIETTKQLETQSKREVSNLKKFNFSDSEISFLLMSHGEERVARNINFIEEKLNLGYVPKNLKALVKDAVAKDYAFKTDTIERKNEENTLIKLENTVKWHTSKNPEHQKNFDKFLKLLKDRVGEATYDSWFKLNLQSIESDEIILETKSKFFKQELINKYESIIAETSLKIFNKKFCSILP